ncbi:MAG: hypothetical protein US62_C0020G0013 [Candidatus Woesebacteria bacterium GW2011_GWA1_37_8]|uniref:Uncharacterized protein n=1 Tax=Candidatus Woesebacteria bacterium GW2011_GWA1_37_8 TaxID=1618546 RepID=A0A0G0I1Z1_9BACT|nr:MAG: hypothetical protein US62_C0020G0013 [Candidatus Woesebacteria bacterium GW2011_GWA1_37_8]
MRTIFNQSENFLYLIIIIIPVLIFTIALFKNLWKNNKRSIRYPIYYFLANIIFVIFNLLFFLFFKSLDINKYNLDFLPKSISETFLFIFIFAILTSIVLAIPLASIFFLVLGLGFLTGNKFITATERKFEMTGTLWSKLKMRTDKLSRTSEIWGGLMAFLLGFSLLSFSLSEVYKFYCNQLKIQSNCNENIIVKIGDTTVRVHNFIGKIIGR